jgi:PAS domain S-box-containing protein
MTLLERWADLSLRSKGMVLATIAAAPLMMVGCTGYVVGKLASRVERRINHSFLVLEEMQRLENSEVTTGAQDRAYFITREEKFADSTRQAIAAFDASRQKLIALVNDDAAQMQRLSEAADIQRSRVERIFSLMTSFRAGEATNRSLRPALLAAEQERVSMENVIRAMKRAEERLLDFRQREGNRMRGAMRAITGLCLLFSLAAAVILWILFQTGVARRLRVISGNVAKLASGSPVLSASAPQDEIGAIGQGVARAAEILNRKTDLLEKSLEGAVHCEASGRYLSFNKAYLELAGFSKCEPPVNLLASIHGDDWQNVETALELMAESGRAESEARIVRPDGSVSEVVMTFLDPTDAGLGGYYVFLSDISLQKQTEAALTRAKDAAIASNAAKTKFLAKISHDIRTPLNAILGAADLLSQTQLDRDQAEYVSMFQRNCHGLVALINDFLDFSKVEAGAVRIEKTPFHLRQTVHDAAETFRESAVRKGVTLDVEIAPEAPDWQLGDPLRLQQVLVNLVSNAIKFTSEGRVCVRLLVEGESASLVLRFEVMDTGPGIRAADRESIFAAFTQLPNQGSTPVRGSGLGLTICRELVHLMGGEIGLSSDEGAGSTFYFTVPLEKTQPSLGAVSDACSAPVPPRLPEDVPLRILIAEDTDDNRILLQHYLRDQPVTLRFAEDGQQAIDAMARGEEFDLILMDIDMPVLDGCTATKRILEYRTNSGKPAIPIVAVSAHAIQESVRACLDAGCVAHVSKPVDRVTLIETIGRYARRKPEPDPPVQCEGPMHPEIAGEIARLVPNYLAAKSRQIEEARACLAARHFDTIRRFGHNLKGTGRGYGFPEIENLGGMLEQAAEMSDERAIAIQLIALQGFVRRAELSVCNL